MGKRYTSKVERLRSLVETIYTTPDNTSLLSIYIDYLNIPSDPPKYILQSVIELNRLTDEVREMILQKNFPESEQNHIIPFDLVTKFIKFLNINAKVSDAKRTMSLVNITHFRTTMSLISDTEMEETIDENQIKELILDIRDLIIIIADTEIPVDLKLFIIDQLELAKFGLLNYKISGAEGIKRTYDNALGSLSIYREKLDVLNKEHIGKLNRIFKSLQKLASKAATHVAIAATAEGIRKLVD